MRCICLEERRIERLVSESVSIKPFKGVGVLSFDECEFLSPQEKICSCYIEKKVDAYLMIAESVDILSEEGLVEREGGLSRRLFRAPLSLPL